VPAISWQGDHVMDSMKYIEAAASDGFLKHLYTFKIAQVLLDSLRKTFDMCFVRERTGTYFDMFLTLNETVGIKIITPENFRYFIMTEFVDQLNNRILLLRHRLIYNENHWVKNNKKKLDELKICIGGVENLYKQLINHKLWNYIFLDMKIIKSSSDYHQVT